MKNRKLPGIKWPIAFFLSILLLLSMSAQVIAQTKTISGTVTDANTEPIIGATVAIKGTSTGTVTDLNGNYTITASPEDVLVFSFVGMIPQESLVGEQTEINVSLDEDLMELDEIVVVGYGTQRKSDLTGSVAVVDADEMARSNFNTVDKALQGRASGVYVSSTSGRPGAGSSIKIRGIGSINEDAEPLIVIDGMPTSDENVLTTINPNDIESMQVLKDASATAIYGARGANGVIIITTKKGKAGDPKLSFNAFWGVSQITKKFDVMNAEQYVDFYDAAYADVPILRNNGSVNPQNFYYTTYSDSARLSNENFNDTDWQDALTQTGSIQNYNLSASGGSEKTRFFLSGGYAKEEGIMVNTAMQRYNFRANSEFDVGKWLTIGENLTYSYRITDDESHFTNFNPWRVTTVASPLMPLYDPNAPGGYGGPTDSLTGPNERTNPVAEQMLNENRNIESWLLGSVYAQVKLFEGLTYKISANANLKSEDRAMWSPVYTLGNLNLRDNDVNSLQEIRSKSRELILLNTLRYTNSFGNHNLNALAGFERTQIDNSYVLAEGTNFEFEDLRYLSQAENTQRIGGGLTEHHLLSYLARLNYDYLGKYLLTVNFRRDGSSRFGPLGGRWGNFPSASVGWKLNEDLLKNVDEISMLKLRFGWGVTGNENLGDYRFLELLDPKQNSRYTFGEDQELYLAAASSSFQASPFIQWEATEMTNFGLDLSLYENRFLLTAEYYIKDQDKMLVAAPLNFFFGKRFQYGSGGAPTTGSWVNLGRMQNKGFELSVSYRKREGVFQYEVGANLTTINNEIIDLPYGDIVSGMIRATEGEPFSIYGHVAERIYQEDDFDENGNLISGIKQTGAQPGDIKFRDVDNDSVITAEDRDIIGNPIPRMVYGFNFNASYRGFDFSLLLQGMYDLDVFSNQRRFIGIASNPDSKDENKLVEALDYWTPENPSTTMTRISLSDENFNSRISSWFVEDASFLRVKTVQLGYTLPVRWTDRINVGMLRLYVNANNLFTFTDYSGYDPEIGSKDPFSLGIDYGNYPAARTYTFGVQINL